jgi:hypothetical protein
MSLTIICVTGPGSTNKSRIIREFTAAYLRYGKAEGDVLGVFPMPFRNYAVGVSGYGDNPKVIQEGLNFLTCYDGLEVMILASRSHGQTIRLVEQFAKKAGAILHLVKTIKLAKREWNAAIGMKVAEIESYMPRRSG